MPKIVFIVAAVILIVGGVLYYVFVLRQPTTEPLEKEQGLGGELFEKTGNPGSVVPETNPFLQVETNPLQGINPFEGGYRNPFE